MIAIALITIKLNSESDRKPIILQVGGAWLGCYNPAELNELRIALNTYPFVQRGGVHFRDTGASGGRTASRRAGSGDLHCRRLLNRWICGGGQEIYRFPPRCLHSVATP